MNREEQTREAARQRANQYDHPSKWSDTYYGFIDGAKWADSHPQWIPVEEKLPEENEEVLAYNSLYNEKYLCVYHNGKFEDYLGELGKGAVSHWMPIVPPRGEE